MSATYTEPAYLAALDVLGVGERIRMLDIGCGAGRALRLAADRGAEVAGLDAAPGLLDYAHPIDALQEAKRVAAHGGRILAMI